MPVATAALNTRVGHRLRVRVTFEVIAFCILLGSCREFHHSNTALPTTPGVRNAHALLYDSLHDELLLFGGADERRVRGDTWSWNGSSWRFLTNDGPEPRTFPAYASDLEGATAYIFGGNRVLFGKDDESDSLFADLWKWDGTRWRQEHWSGPSPDARTESAMAFDQRRGRLVLFGGRSKAGGKSVRLGDTWEWDGTSWLLMSRSGPAPRSGMAMVYDSGRGVTVLFGGSTGVASGETWEWDGARWTFSQGMATPRFNAVMAYDVSLNQTVRFGGWFDGRRWNDTWCYNGTFWVYLGSRGPSPRNHTALAYDFHRGAVVLVGGHDGARVFGDIWEWRGGRWTELLRAEPKARIDNGH